MTIWALRLAILVSLLLATVPVRAELEEFRTLLMQNAAVATGDGTAINVDAHTSLMLQATFAGTATVTIEGTIDGTTWIELMCNNVATNVPATTATTNSLTQCSIHGLSKVRARISSWSSGAVTVVGRVSTAPMSVAHYDVNLATLFSGENQTSNLLETSGGVARGTEGNLINSAVGDATSAAFTLPTGWKTITGRITGAGSVAQVITVYGGTSSSMAAATSDVVCTITLSGTSGAAGTAYSCPPFIAPFLFYIAVTSGSAGTPTTILTGSY